MKPASYMIPDEDAMEGLKAGLRDEFFALAETSETTELTVYDTFDWRLFQSGLHLVRQADRITLIDAETDLPVDRLTLGRGKPLRFHADLPPSGISQRLEAVMEMRALMPMITIHTTRDMVAVLNEDEKTVVRLQLATSGLAGESDGVRRCHLAPLKGYAKAARKVHSIIEASGFPPAGPSPVLELLKKSGARPGEYSSKVNVTLDPEMPAARAVQCVMQRLLEVMHLNLPGVRDDIDTEFLHDLRVSVRRARSLLGQTKGVLDSRTTANLQAQLKTVGDVTGQVRDLDVYLLAQTDYITKVPELLQPGVVRLFQTLKRKRQYAFQRMLSALNKPEFAAVMNGIEAFVGIDPLADSDAASGSMPVRELARTVITKRFRKVIKKGRRISSSSPDERLHELRIDCKKLRYLLEFFTSLFPAEEMKKLIKQLKQFQENLGTFNDLSVQQDFLAEYLTTIKPTMAQALPLAAATGGLITRLNADQRKVREAFFAAFNAFDAPENRQRFKSLFA